MRKQPGDAHLNRLFAPQMVEYIDSFDVSIIFDLVEAIYGPEDEVDDDEGELESDDCLTVETALLCADDSHRPGVEGPVSDLGEFNQILDDFADDLVSQLAQRAGWPQALAPLGLIVTNTAPISIVIGGRNDALSPVELSEQMATAIGGFFFARITPAI